MGRFIYVFGEESRVILIDAGFKQMPCAMKTGDEGVYLFVLDKELPEALLNNTYITSDTIVL